MIVVTLQYNDKETILRGAAAKQLVDDCPFRKWVPIQFTSGRQPLIRAVLGMTADETVFLLLDDDTLTDTTASLLFEDLYEHILRQKGGPHARK
jgi:hypothetical protein